MQGLSSAGLALALLLALLLTQGPAPVPPVTPAAPPQAQPVAAPPQAAPPARAAAAPRPLAAPRRVAAPPPAARRRAAAPAAPAAPAKPVARTAHAAMDRSYLRDAQGGSVCPAGAQSTDVGLTCRGAQVQLPRERRGYLLGFQVCPTTAGRLQLRFDGEAEVAMRLLDGEGRAVWTWRPDRPFATHPHVLDTEVGACWQWDTLWRQVDDDGRPLPPGRYALEVDFLEVDDTGTYLQRFEVRS